MQILTSLLISPYTSFVQQAGRLWYNLAMFITVDDFRNLQLQFDSFGNSNKTGLQHSGCKDRSISSAGGLFTIASTIKKLIQLMNLKGHCPQF